MPYPFMPLNGLTAVSGVAAPKAVGFWQSSTPLVTSRRTPLKPRQENLVLGTKEKMSESVERYSAK